MALTKVSGGILDPGINVAGIVTATGFDGPFIGGGDGVNAGVGTFTGLDVNGNGDISGNLVVGGNLTANGDFTTLNTTLREVELLRVDAQDNSVAAGIITQRGSGNILELYDTSTNVLTVKDGGNVGIGTVSPETNLTIAKNATNQTVATIPTVRLTNLDTTAVASDIVGSYEFFSKDAHSNNKVTGFMRNTPTDAGVNYDLTFGTIKTGDSNAVERLRITSDGEVGINTTVVPYGNFAVDHGQYGLTRISEYSHLLLQNKNAGTTEFWTLAPRDNGRFGIGRGTPASAGQISDEKFTILSDGKVGIGTNNPDYQLNVVSPSGKSSIEIKSKGTGANDDVFLRMRPAGTSKDCFIDFGDDDDADIGGIRYNHSNDFMTFTTNTDERLRITSGGQLVIGHDTSHFIDGSSNGHFRLQVSGTNYATSGITQQRFEDNNSGATLALAHSRNGTQGSHTILAVNDEYGKIRFYGSDGTDFEGYGAAIVAKVETGIAANSTPGRLEFHTTASGNQDATERLRITHTGNIGVGGSTGTDFSLLDGMVINTDNGDAGLMVNSSSSSHNAYISFSYGSGSSTSHADQFSAYVGRVGNDNLIFGTQNSLRWRIDSSGHLVPQTAGTVNVGSATTEIGDVYIADSKKAYFGSDQDFQISHNGSHAIVKETTGRLYLLGDDIWFKNQADDESLARFMNGGEVFLYNNDNLRLTTTTTGITVGGEVATAQDYPNFRPTLDLNFVAEKKLDSRITYSRTGPTSFVNEFGKVVLIGDNTPRFDHDPLTRECKGYLVEESRTNQWLYSEDLVTYVTGGAMQQSTLANTTATTDPTGGTNAVKMAATATGGAHSFYKNFTSGSNGDTHTASVWVKAAGVDYARLYVDTVGGNMGGPGVTFSTGNTWNVSASGSATQVATSVVEYPNGWWRLSVSGSFSGQNAYYVHIDLEGGEGDVSFTGNGSDGMYVWGVQFESGAFPTSYIPTNGETATRGADTTFIDGDDFTDFYNQPEGTIVSSHSLLDNIPTTHNVYTYQVAPDSGTSEAPFRLIDRNGAYGNTLVATSITNNAIVAFFKASGDPVTPANKKMKVAFAIKTNDFAASFNGDTVVTDTSGTVSQTNDHLAIGYYKPSPQAYLNGHIQRLMYYPRRLSNTQLQNLSS